MKDAGTGGGHRKGKLARIDEREEVSFKVHTLITFEPNYANSMY